MPGPVKPIKDPVKPSAQALSELVNKLEGVRTKDLHFAFIYFSEETKKAGVRYCTGHNQGTKSLIDALRQCANQIELEMNYPKPPAPGMGVITQN